MEILTIDIINNLKKEGYLYLLGQTISVREIAESSILTRINLTPTNLDLNVEVMPAAYDCYFNLNNDEAIDLVDGADGVEFFIYQES